MMDSPAWQSLSLGARCLLLEVWNRHTGENNGAISMSIREAATLLGAGKNSTDRWFHELEHKGFLIARRRGAFTLKTRTATAWELTMEPCDGRAASKEFMRWRPPEIQNTVPLMGTHGPSHGDTRNNITPDGPSHGDRGA